MHRIQAFEEGLKIAFSLKLSTERGFIFSQTKLVRRKNKLTNNFMAHTFDVQKAKQFE